MSIYTDFKPTRLYIKQHTITGLKYFGKSSQQDLEKYKGSGRYWIDHINKHGKEHVVNLWISEWYHDQNEIQEISLHFSKENDIINSLNTHGKKTWANLKEEDGLTGGCMSKESYGIAAKNQSYTKSTEEWKNGVGLQSRLKCSATQKSQEWQNTVGKSKKIKESETKSQLEWKSSVGEMRVKNYMETVNSDVWLSTVGIQKSEKIRESRLDPAWKDTVGINAIKKKIETISDPVWKDTIGKEAKIKMVETRNDPDWISKNSCVCIYCGGSFMKGNYSNHHGERCKLNPNRPVRKPHKRRST